LDRVIGKCELDGLRVTIPQISRSFYDPLVKHFVDQNYQIGTNLFIYTYDWRKDVTAVADGLDELIKEAVLKSGAPQVDIVAHSLGGLVTAKYIRDSQRAINVRKAVILGTPFLGTPKGFRALQDGDCMMPGLELPVSDSVSYEIICFPAKATVRHIAANMPSMYQIMPYLWKKRCDECDCPTSLGIHRWPRAQ
jgi:pimeloyl-ACP methyl ester carboxylesterase